MRKYETIVPDQTEHEQLSQAVEKLSEKELRKKFVRLIEAIQPQVNCVCSDLGKVTEHEAQVCAFHQSLTGWIVDVAREETPLVSEI